jgi:hypothetical protein
MACCIVFFVPLFCEVKFNPLHYLGKRLIWTGRDKKMDMIIHYTKIVEDEIILFLCERVSSRAERCGKL